jgi:endonuclease YncB( thermonuclease family)
VRRFAAAALLLMVVAAGAGLALRTTHDRHAGEGVVSHIRDGDTIELTNGDVVRLVQIDTPELSEGECYAQRARGLLQRLLPVGTHVRIAEDRRLDHVDRYGRRLAYVLKDRLNVNRFLVARGAAGVWFFEGDRGEHASAFLATEQRAKAHRVGLWRGCPGTRLDPLEPIDSGTH